MGGGGWGVGGGGWGVGDGGWGVGDGEGGAPNDVARSAAATELVRIRRSSFDII
jgi:hypothetical protein